MLKRAILLLLLCMVIYGTYLFTVSTYNSVQWYVTVQTQNPIFALPSSDLSKIKTSVDSLERSRSRIATIAREQYEPPVVDKINDYLYPTEWWNRMIDLEETRRLMIDNPSATTAETYHNQLITTIDMYLKYTRNLMKTLDSLELRPFDPVLFFATGSSHDSYVRSVIYDYHHQALAQKTIAQDRWDCYQSFIYAHMHHCDSSPFSTHVTHTDEIHPTSQGYLDIIRDLRTGIVPGHEHTPTTVYLADPACYGDMKNSPYHLWWEEKQNGSRFLRAEHTRDIIVTHREKNAETVLPYDELFFSYEGSEYRFQSMTNIYTCPDVAHDISTILSLLYLHESLKEIDQSIYDTLQPSLKTSLVNLHNTIITNTESLSQVLVEQYIEILSQRMDMIPSRLQQIVYDYHYKTASLSHQIESIEQSNNAIISYSSLNQWDYLRELLYIRSTPSVLLGGTNPSVIPRPQSLIETKNPNMIHSRFIRYSELEETIPPSQMRTLLRDSLRATRLIDLSFGLQ